MNESILCIADCHLTLSNFKKFEEKLKKKITKSYDKIFILGDLVDESYEFYSDSEFQTFLTKIQNLILFFKEKSKEVIVFYGNHDELFFKEYGEKLRVNCVNTKEMKNEKLIFLHGHQFDKRIIFHKLFVFFGIKKTIKRFSKKHLKKYFNCSFRSQKNKAKQYIKYKFGNTHSTIVLGHFHKYEKISTTQNNFIVVPAFFKNFEITEFIDSKVHII